MALLLHHATDTRADALYGESLELLRSLWRYVEKLERLHGKKEFPEGTPERWRRAVRCVAEAIKSAPSEVILEIGGRRRIVRNMVARDGAYTHGRNHGRGSQRRA